MKFLANFWNMNTNSDDTKKRKRRNLLVFPRKNPRGRLQWDDSSNDGYYSSFDESSVDEDSMILDEFSIDEDDYRVIEETVLGASTGLIQSVTVTSNIPGMVRIKNDDEERRVYKLRFRKISVSFLPPSIGQLQHLKYLDLSDWTKNMVALPEEIGNLVRLEKLKLTGADLASLPPAMGRLYSLRVLDLGATGKLKSLPKEIGNLGRLEKLILHHSGIMELPSSVGGLKNLKYLDLSHTKSLLTLPAEIGNLRGLEYLNLQTERIMGIGGHIPGDWWQRNLFFILKRMRHVLTSKKAHHRNVFMAPNQQSTNPMAQKLLPLMLHHAPRAFDDIVVMSRKMNPAKPDAMFRILIDGMEDFLRVLINRHRHDRSTEKAQAT